MNSALINLPSKDEINTWLDEQVSKGFIKEKNAWIDWQFKRTDSRDIFSWLHSDQDIPIDSSIKEYFFQCMYPRHINLYYYASAESACKILSSWSIKGTDINNTNDPYEFLPVAQEPISLIRDYPKIICFSRLISSPALWGHYGDNHRGVCFVFRFPLVAYYCVDPKHKHWRVADKMETSPIVNTIQKVRYDFYRSELDHKYYNCDNDTKRTLFASYLESMVSTKDKSWEFEQEYRFICDATESKDNVFFKFPMDYLKGIVLGINYSKNDFNKCDVVKHADLCRNPDLKIIQSFKHGTKFMVENELYDDTEEWSFPSPFMYDRIIKHL